MTVTENPGRLQVIFTVSATQKRTESITNVKPTATDQDLYDIGSAIANLLNDTLSDIRRSSSKSYAA
ncbi:MAG: DUF1659 domain-containing protein [Caldisericaceae bacterium]